MSSSGKKKNNGNKSEWNHGKTKVVRVPEALVDQVIEYARKLDQGETKDNDIKQVTSMLKVIDLSDISLISISGQMGVRLSDLVDKGYYLKPQRINDIVLASLKSKRK